MASPARRSQPLGVRPRPGPTLQLAPAPRHGAHAPLCCSIQDIARTASKQRSRRCLYILSNCALHYHLLPRLPAAARLLTSNHATCQPRPAHPTILPPPGQQPPSSLPAPPYVIATPPHALSYPPPTLSVQPLGYSLFHPLSMPPPSMPHPMHAPPTALPHPELPLSIVQPLCATPPPLKPTRFCQPQHCSTTCVLLPPTELFSYVSMVLCNPLSFLML